MTEVARLTGDRAISNKDDDRLGFRPVAARIATSLIDHSSENGLVVGVEGAWGSGKSSLLYLIEDELKGIEESKRPTLVNFRPWLFRDRDALLPALFREFTVAIDSIYQARGDATRASLTQAKDAALAIRSFTKAVGRAGDIIQFAGELSALPPVTWIGKGVKAAGTALDKQEPRSISASKDKLVKSLRELDQSIIVTIDDVDRLEPREAFEVLRLIRSVADFPNVIYLLCYDSDVLAESIQKTAGVEDGHRFLEKIIQLTVTVPTPEPFQLRGWFTDELKNIGAPSDDNSLERLREVVDWDGGRRLKTPRAVIRVLDAIRFAWPALESEGADFSDVVWLQLIKNDNLSLYRWIESYLASQSVVALQIGQVDQADRASDAETLAKTDVDGFFRSLNYRYHFAERLPGVDADFNDQATIPKIYQKVSKDEQDKAIAQKRLSSPDHYRLYFTLDAPSHTPTQKELAEFWESLGTDDAYPQFLKLYDHVVVGSFTKADVLLERLNTTDADGLSPDRSRKLLLLLSNILDDAYLARPFDRFWFNSIWDRAERLLPKLLSTVGDERHQAVGEMFVSGKALNWLTGVFRRETFAHGRYGDDKKPESEWYLSDAELDAASHALLERYSALSSADLIGAIDPVNILYAWRQGGDEGGAQQLATATAQSDEGLISLLESMRGKVTSTAGRYYILKRANIEPFLNYDEARSRIETIATDESSPELAARAKGLVVDFQFGEHN